MESGIELTHHTVCHKRRLKQGVAHELPLIGTWTTSVSLHLALSSLPTFFPVLLSCLILLILSPISIHRSPPVLTHVAQTAGQFSLNRARVNASRGPTPSAGSIAPE
ncbi:hypothetical protein PoB_000727200 [Plakobranchus ocellatus]|uniref:Uncharacterized protein n=1 Tax=Plakobranchus ocellatus TaxID=259542 RepID=A0AAV3YF33_9GAST|nr:hypothetical protein PoB_000727200 [Plakobranchus ocellatus]